MRIHVHINYPTWHFLEGWSQSSLVPGEWQIHSLQKKKKSCFLESVLMLMQGLTVSSLITHLQIKKTLSPNEFPIKKKSPSIQFNPLTYLSSEKVRFWWCIFLTKSLKPTSATWRGKTCTDLISMVKSSGRKRCCISGALIWNSDLEQHTKLTFMRNSNLPL